MAQQVITTVTVTRWADLLDELYRDSWDSSIARFRSPYVFRGLSDLNCPLNTRLMRFGAGHEDLAKLEGHLLRNFRKYAYSEIGPNNSVWHCLAVAQHHGLQTRLLDWTYSPFIALHFVTEDLACYKHDGVIWCLNHRETTRLLPEQLRTQADEEGFDVFTAEMLDRAAKSLREFDSLTPDQFVVFLEPPSVDPRITNQFALFSVMSSASTSMDRWLETHSQLARKIVIPAELKWEVRDKLDQAGITERMLYPGLDGLARWLNRYYVRREGGQL